jgi:cation diffusion facilitator CzcD-associated flavoprotein CzcO/acetyl esterase/lipase
VSTRTEAANGSGGRETTTDVDVVVVGAGFSGLYLLHRVRALGLTAQGFETGDDVGGTWYWNRYPGARCDVETPDYSYSFDAELDEQWEWSERYATQPEILRYLDHVANRHDLRRDIRFRTRVTSATWEEGGARWRIQSDQGDDLTCRYFVMATGCLSQPKLPPDIEGVERFAGDIYYTSNWPHDGVDLAGRRVGVIGTGSSGVQSIPIIAEQAESVTVFQRTPSFALPALNGPVSEEKRAAFTGRRAEYREEARWSLPGVPGPDPTESALDVTDEERRTRYEAAWRTGTLFGFGGFYDLVINEEANATAATFIHDKIRSIVRDPETAEALCPTDYPFYTKRPCLDTNYYATFNRPNVQLVNLRKDPITTITEDGVETASTAYELDALVFATGFDAMTGAVLAVDIRGRDGIRLKDKWADGPAAYLGLTVSGFPNLFLVTGPGSPSVLSNMIVSIEQHVDWICDTVDDLRSRGLGVIEATETAEAGWVRHVHDAAELTLFPTANSWYLGANVPGKPRVFLAYLGGVGPYRQICNDVVEQGYLGFALGPADGSGKPTSCNDGVIRPLQPDVAFLLDMMAKLDLPAIESMTPEEARAYTVSASEQRPPGPEVGETVDGTLPGAAGDLSYRLFRPASEGPHPVVVYFHGGGWVMGSEVSDEPLCRDLCVRADSIVVSVDYRHAPEHPFPAAPDDALAAVEWVSANLESLGGRPGGIVLCGFSAGANLAAVTCQTARDNGGPEILGQVLINPVTDSDLSRPSYRALADGYGLTGSLMQWFWDNYADPGLRDDPRVSPLQGDHANLPPALVLTSEFDPLRDEGAAYAEALAEAGVEVRHVMMRGQIHMSVASVGIIPSATGARDEVAAAIRRFFETAVPAGQITG